MRYLRFNNTGFTLIEVVCVATILGILSSMAFPQFGKTLGKWELDVATRQMASDIRKWQHVAVTEQDTYKLVVDTANKKYYFRKGMLSLEKHDLSSSLKRLSATQNFNNVYFYPSGTPNIIGHYTLENNYGEIKYVVVNITGRVRVTSSLPK